MRGETGRATGWLARAQRLLERETRECAERGYLLLPVVEQQIAAGDFEAAYATARPGRRDRRALRRRGPRSPARATSRAGFESQQGQIEEGLALLDEAMVAVTAGELSPLVTGLMYCSVIAGLPGRSMRSTARASGPPR